MDQLEFNLDAEGTLGIANIALHDYIENMKRRFGADFYIELSDNGLPGQKQLIDDLVTVSKHYGLPIVATADVHYIKKDQSETHGLLTAIKNSLTRTDIRNRNRDVRFHFTDNEEMQTLFSQWPEALHNSIEIAKKCSFIDIEMNRFYLPKFDLGLGETADESLIRLSKEGLEERLKALAPLYGESLNEEKIKEYHNRLEFELKVITGMGFPGYFLIVQDFINWAKKHDIPVGPGRGSGAGSLVAYALKITDLDPLPYNLIFERFLNPDRISMPDFDVDFCQWRREEVIHYVTEKYGSENVAQIVTFGKLMAKGAIKSVGRALNLGYNRIDRFTKLFPDVLNISLSDALEQEPKLRDEMEKDSSLKEVVDYAFQIEGLTSHTSVHAAGVVISDGPMTDYVPVFTTDGENFVTQYEMKKAEKVGLVKFDFLGLKTLTVIHKAVEIVHLLGHKDFDIANIAMDEEKVFQFISSGATCGIFQLESSGMTALVKKLKPSCFEDIIALVALFRPGPLGSGMVDDFVERKHGRQEITYPHPDLEPILKETYGMILYQEQVQKIAAVLANYTLGEADILRRAMGKKDADEMERQKNRFLTGAQENNIEAALAAEIFDLMAEFAKYGFNKSHSAAYGLVSYQTAFLKTFYPEAYMAAIMTCDLDNTSKIVRYIEDCHNMGFSILAPDINRNNLEFTTDKPKQIEFGLAAIKGIGESVLTPIIEEREKNGPYKGLTDLALRVDLGKVGKKTLELLIQVGALDKFGYSRKQIFALVKDIVTFSSKHFESKHQGQRTLFDLVENEEESTTDKGAPWDELKKEALIKGKAFDLEGLYQERKLLGVFLSGHPLDFYQTDLKSLGSAKIADFAKIADQNSNKGRDGKTAIGIIALLSNYNERRTQKGTLMGSFKLEQLDASIEGVMFEKALEQTNRPPIDSIVMAYGIVDYNFDKTMIRFTLNRITPLEEVRQERVKAITFEIPADIYANQREVLERKVAHLKSIVDEANGPTPYRIKLRYKNTDVLISPQSETGVELSDNLLSKLREISYNHIETEYSLATLGLDSSIEQQQQNIGASQA
ncbi:MAG: DNA polymerase III subunit alpha [Bdellovibrionota bacterium]